MKKKVAYSKFFFTKQFRYVFQALSLSIVLSIVVYTSIQGAYRLGSAFFVCPAIDITCVDCFSPELKKKLVTFVRSSLSQVNFLSFDAKNFYSNLRQEFDCVKKVTITKRLLVGLFVKINFVKPVMMINQKCVLAENRCIYPRTYFARYDGLDRLPDVSMPKMKLGMQLTQGVYDGLITLAPSLSKNYALTYINPSTIKLIPRTPKRYAVVVCNEAILKANQQQLDTLDDFVQDALQRGFCSKTMLDSKRRSVELDLRFERRVIVKFIDHAKRRGKVS